MLLKKYSMILLNVANFTCGGDIFVESKRSIDTPYFPNLECVWILSVPKGQLIHLRFDSFKVPIQPQTKV